MRIPRVQLLGLALALFLGVSTIMTACNDAGSNGQTEFKTYTDSHYGFSFDYPSGWQLTATGVTTVGVGAEPTAQVIAIDPKGAMADGIGLDLVTVRVYELDQTIDESMLPSILEYLQATVAGLQAQDPSVQIERSLEETSVGGVKGYQLTTTLEWSDGTPLRDTSYYLFAGELEYELIVQATTANWEKNQDEFAAFLASFKP